MSGEVRPLRGSYLLQLFASGRLLCRRQDMTDDAFFDYNALVHIRERVQDWIDTSPHAGESKAGIWARFDADAAFLTLLAALSYRWLSREHPDPEVFHLRIMAGVIRARWTLKVAQTLAFFRENFSCRDVYKYAGMAGDVDLALFWVRREGW